MIGKNHMEGLREATIYLHLQKVYKKIQKSTQQFLFLSDLIYLKIILMVSQIRIQFKQFYHNELKKKGLQSSQQNRFIGSKLMGNNNTGQNQSFRQKISQIIDESKIHIQRFNLFSKQEEQIPYAEPLEQNIFKGSPEDSYRLNRIIEKQELKKPDIFTNNDGYEYDEKFWKKKNPMVVIQGCWYRRVPHGLSKFYFPGGKTVFVSYFNHGIPILDDCLIVFENGAYYRGGLSNYRFNGFGKWVNDKDSITIECQWKDGVPVGQSKQKIVNENEIIQFEGDYSLDGQRCGKKCSYKISKKQNPSQTLFEYKGSFQNGSFSGNSFIKTHNAKYEFETNFHEDKVEIKHLQTEELEFEGEFEKNFSNGHGKFRNLKTNSRVIYEGDIQNGIFDGPGSIINEDNSVQKVYWYEGLKLKHFRNFEQADNLSQIIHQIEQAYQKSNTYSEMTKLLADQFKQIQNVQIAEGISPRRHQYSYLFEMISKEKVNSIIGPSKVSQPSPTRNLKKQLILQLDKGKYLYFTCFKLHPNQKAPQNK